VEAKTFEEAIKKIGEKEINKLLKLSKKLKEHSTPNTLDLMYTIKYREKQVLKILG
jgi:hypothetical protein